MSPEKIAHIWRTDTQAAPKLTAETAIPALVRAGIAVAEDTRFELVRA